MRLGHHHKPHAARNPVTNAELSFRPERRVSFVHRSQLTEAGIHSVFMAQFIMMHRRLTVGLSSKTGFAHHEDLVDNVHAGD